MKKRYIFLLIIVGIVVAYNLAYPSYTYRYRMTVEVDTPDGVKSGSSVIEVHTTQWPESLRHLFGGKISHSTARGEAVFVDLGNGKNVVALLARGHFAEIGRIREWPAISLWGKEEANKMGGYGSATIAKKLTKMIGEEIDFIPTIVTFNDPKNPESIEVLYAEEINWDNNLKPKIIDKIASKFGKEFKFKSSAIQLTDDDYLEDNLIEHLPWSNDNKECRKAWYKIASNPPKGKRFHFTYMCKNDGSF